MNTEKFYGDNCTRSPSYISGATGIVVGDVRMQAGTYQAAKRIHAAGPDGEAAGRATLTEIDIMRAAGISVRTDSIGSRWWIDDLPNPTAWLVPIAKSPAGPGKLCGPFGGGLEPAGPGYRGDYNAAPAPWK